MQKVLNNDQINEALNFLKIWKLLSNLSSQQGKTIVITTHYIDEAKEANSIGLQK